ARMNSMVSGVAALVGVGLAISLPVAWLLIRAGHKLGALDSAGAAGHAKVLRRVPNIGGIAIFWAVALPMTAGLLALQLVSEETIGKVLPSAVEHLGRMRSSAGTAWAMLACMTVLHVMGLVDDRRSLGPGVKLLVQVGAAAAMAVWFKVRLLTMVDAHLGMGQMPSIVITIAWIVVITNAVNFLDNMDGLAGGVSAIAGSLFMAATIVNAQWFIAGTLALMVGGLIGFLVFNFPPAKIFMGDGGSLVVGFLLAILTARTTFYDAGNPNYALGTGWYGVFMPVVVLAVPLYDFVTVTTLRLRQGKSPMVGDQQHFSHRLVQRGLSKRGAVMVIWGATLVTGIGGISLGSLKPWQAALVGVQTLAVIGVIGLLEHASRRASAHRAESE
ncbi:MAG TPA: MraY family glycosyltransferase, partial [Phycisphaerales bacterium]|nr:MraY family glycosyltransferase [Phycisphaerales bacterium]